jgi:hypothetical protein
MVHKHDLLLKREPNTRCLSFLTISSGLYPMFVIVIACIIIIGLELEDTM